MRWWAIIVLALLDSGSVFAHDIYTGVKGKDGLLCCGGTDCAATTWRPGLGGKYEFLTKQGQWVTIPQERITFLPIPGDDDSGGAHHAHLCSRPANIDDRIGWRASNVFGDIYLYCAFIPPGTM